MVGGGGGVEALIRVTEIELEAAGMMAHLILQVLSLLVLPLLALLLLPLLLPSTPLLHRPLPAESFKVSWLCAGRIGRAAPRIS